MKDVSPFVVLDYIKSTIEILMNMKFDESSVPKSVRSDLAPTVKAADVPRAPAGDYETMLQQVEGEVRHHISVRKVNKRGRSSSS